MLKSIKISKRFNVLVLGAGNFGTCLAHHLASEMKYNVTMWARDPSVVKAINESHKNIRYMKDVDLPKNITAVNDIENGDEAEMMWKKVDVIVFCIPTQFLRKILQPIKSRITKQHLLILANKGIENNSLELPYHIIEDALGEEIGTNAVYLSGPSFAVEVVKKLPTAVTVASKNIDRAILAQGVFHSPVFRVYHSDDPIGVEIAGALKNVIAIASGICTGLGFQSNTRAALLTRGLGEITQVGAAMGANPLSFIGLAGVGDLFLTATSEKSRNFTVGFRLGKGEKLDDIVNSLGSVAEGVTTSLSAYQLTQKLKLDTPIIDEVYRILYEGKDVRLAVRDLINSVARPEVSVTYSPLTPQTPQTPQTPNVDP